MQRDDCAGPCLPHCYSCPTEVVYASNFSTVIVVAIVFVVIAAYSTDSSFLSTLTPVQRDAYKCMQQRLWNYFLFGIIVGSFFMLVYRPYTKYKLV